MILKQVVQNPSDNSVKSLGNTNTIFHLLRESNTNHFIRNGAREMHALCSVAHVDFSPASVAVTRSTPRSVSVSCVQAKEELQRVLPW
jgi:hypothetical protein